MARTLGARNRTPRELETAAKQLREKAKLKKQIEALKKKQRGSRPAVTYVGDCSS
jgi:hypothetical protein